MTVSERTDRELVRVFGAFAGREVVADSHLDERTRVMVHLASTIACQCRVPSVSWSAPRWPGR